MDTSLWRGNRLEKTQLQYQEGDGRMRWILGDEVLNMGLVGGSSALDISYQMIQKSVHCSDDDSNGLHSGITSISELLSLVISAVLSTDSAFFFIHDCTSVELKPHTKEVVNAW
jgi:hypothetical protein